MLDIVNKYVAKISLALEEGDSILHLSKKIGGSYGWTHKWVKELENLGVVKRENGIKVVDEALWERYRQLGREILRKKLDLKDAYLLPNFSGMRYAFTKTDAVFIWTKGGYQIARSKSDYPIFMNVLKDDLERWNDFFAEYSVDYCIEERDGKGIYFVLYPRKEFNSEWVEDASVIPLKETVEWAKRYEINFQPALEMLDEMYDVDMGTKYRERAMA